MNSILRAVEIPPIGPETSSRLDEPFTISELRTTLTLMQHGKFPGPDGFPADFLKTFADKLSPLLINMFNESLQAGILPPTLRQTTLILKKDKDPLSCNNYRPISLLCTDVQLLAKMLAGRLESVLPTIISTDQNCVRTNNYYSEYFPLTRGTLQGCPLSPLLIAIAIEPLAVALRSRGGIEHKFYADDLPLFISDSIQFNSIQFNSIQFYLYSAKLQQLSSQGT